jgi:hypothetical protein
MSVKKEIVRDGGRVEQESTVRAYSVQLSPYEDENPQGDVAFRGPFSVLGDTPIDASVGWYYAECTFASTSTVESIANDDTGFTIGLANSKLPADEMPGEVRYSYGYMTSQKRVSCGGQISDAYGERVLGFCNTKTSPQNPSDNNAAEVQPKSGLSLSRSVGLFLSFWENSVSFTIDQQNQGVAFRNVHVRRGIGFQGVQSAKAARRDREGKALTELYLALGFHNLKKLIQVTVRVIDGRCMKPGSKGAGEWDGNFDVISFVRRHVSEQFSKLAPTPSLRPMNSLPNSSDAQATGKRLNGPTASTAEKSENHLASRLLESSVAMDSLVAAHLARKGYHSALDRYLADHSHRSRLEGILQGSDESLTESPTSSKGGEVSGEGLGPVERSRRIEQLRTLLSAGYPSCMEALVHLCEWRVQIGRRLWELLCVLIALEGCCAWCLQRSGAARGAPSSPAPSVASIMQLITNVSLIGVGRGEIHHLPLPISLDTMCSPNGNAPLVPQVTNDEAEAGPPFSQEEWLNVQAYLGLILLTPQGLVAGPEVASQVLIPLRQYCLVKVQEQVSEWYLPEATALSLRTALSQAVRCSALMPMDGVVNQSMAASLMERFRLVGPIRPQRRKNGNSAEEAFQAKGVASAAGNLVDALLDLIDLETGFDDR